MEPVTTITISCQGATTVSLDELQDLQGDLKDLTEENYTKLRNSIIQFGFSFPIFIWIDGDNTKWIIDAHQRIRTLQMMQQEGIEIPPLPADIIFADNKIQAKEKLLLLNSQYGHMTQEGFDAFTADVPIEDISDMLVLPDVMIEDTNDAEETQENPSNDPRMATCPECNTTFEVR